MDSHSRFGRSFCSSGGGEHNKNNNNNNSQCRRYSRSRSCFRDRRREQAGYWRRNSHSRSRDHLMHHNRIASGNDNNLCRNLNNVDCNEERGNRYGSYKYALNKYYQHRCDGDRERDRLWNRASDCDRDRNYDQEARERNSYYEKEMDRSGNKSDGRYPTEEESCDSDVSDDTQHRRNHIISSNEALNQIIIFGLKKHINQANIMSALMQVNMEPSSIRIIRKKSTGASRGFAFVKFNTVEEAAHWMEITKGTLKVGDQHVSLEYSITDWNCAKCGVYNFKRRFICFMCQASRAESDGILSGRGEGIDEVSLILTKRIMLRNLDALTNEESVLTALQKVLPKLAKTVNKVLISRDKLTQTSRGICYLNFETLVDSMDVHNALNSLEKRLQIDDRDISISYCMDAESQEVSKHSQTASNSDFSALTMPPSEGVYTLADVPRLAIYSASLYASTPAEQALYVQYYTDYFETEINKGGPLYDGQLFGGPPFSGQQLGEQALGGDPHVTEANSGAAVALSAIHRKQKRMCSIETTATAAATAAAQAAAAVKATFAALNVVTPKGNDGKTYPTPDVTQYQYDETSGYYYDPSTGLYYDAHSQYYYNNETGAYLYWDQRRSTYILATPASTRAALKESLALEARDKETAKKDKDKTKVKDNNKHDKVKVAKKIVKDMEKWAKQLNQRKYHTVVATPQPILAGRGDPIEGPSTSRAATGAYADVGFSILEKKERAKLNDYVPPSATATLNKFGNTHEGGSDSGEEIGNGAIDDMDYVDFQKLTCLLCKRAFQSHDTLLKHLKMSSLHKENLVKLSMSIGVGAGLSYRDRAKERRLKYGEGDPPPPNRSRERFEHEIKKFQTRQKDRCPAPALPISSNNVGSRLLQKMGWSEGQGLGRKNQGRTQIIEAEGRSNNVGLGNQIGVLAAGDDYKTYIKKKIRVRYENR